MSLLFVVCGVLVLVFGFVVAFGAPYLPTFKGQAEKALDLLDLKPGQTLLELGCGDGRVALAAARRGVRVVGYELNPLLVVVAKVVTWRQRKLVTIRLGNFWRATWPPADAIFVFLLDQYMSKLDNNTIQYRQRIKQKQPLKLLSYAFLLPGHKPVASRDGLFLYKYQ